MATLLYATRSAPGGAREDVQRKGPQALAYVCALLSSSAHMLTVIEGGPADKLAETKKSEQARREAHKLELQAQKSKKHEVRGRAYTTSYRTGSSTIVLLRSFRHVSPQLQAQTLWPALYMSKQSMCGTQCRRHLCEYARAVHMIRTLGDMTCRRKALPRLCTSWSAPLSP